MIGGETLQAIVASDHDAPPTSVVWVDFADKKYFIALTGDCLTDDLLGCPVAVHLSGIDQAHAELEAELECLDLARALAVSLTHVPGPEAQHGHRHAIDKLQSGYRSRHRSYDPEEAFERYSIWRCMAGEPLRSGTIGLCPSTVLIAPPRDARSFVVRARTTAQTLVRCLLPSRTAARSRSKVRPIIPRPTACSAPRSRAISNVPTPGSGCSIRCGASAAKARANAS